MTAPGALTHPVVDAALRAVVAVTGMETAFVGALDEGTFTFCRVRGSWPGIDEGAAMDAADSLCARLLTGAPLMTADIAADPAYAGTPAAELLGATSYIGVPIWAADGRLLGTLCALDHGSVEVGTEAVLVLEALASVVAAHVQAGGAGVSLRRTPQGWQVDGGPEAGLESELVTALTLADLLAGDSPTTARPPKPRESLDEVGRLRLSVLQLEHALAARVIVEQAIGVLAQRHGTSPRAAFERLRKAARSRGRRVHDLAREVVASAYEPGVPLPPELAVTRRP